jgi:hypothetical protein
MVAAARKWGRMVQVGSQGRSAAHKIQAVQLLQSGVIGRVYMAKGLCYKRRKSIGHTPIEPVPPGVDWDKFRGPAPMIPFSKNHFLYNWHWFWDTGNGDIGNQGVHEMDIARMGGWASDFRARLSRVAASTYTMTIRRPRTRCWRVSTTATRNLPSKYVAFRLGEKANWWQIPLVIPSATSSTAMKAGWPWITKGFASSKVIRQN